MLRMKHPFKMVFLFGSLLAARAATAEDLADVYRQAQASDPQYLASSAQHQAALEVKPQSLAGLLPAVSLNGDASRDRFDPRNSGTTRFATNQVYGVNLRQPLFRRDRFIQLQQADSRIAQADAVFESAQQELILRVATRYFAVLGARDDLVFVRADKAALTRTLDQAQQRFEVGLAAITDKLKAQAAYDLSLSDEISAEQQLADSREALREITGTLPGPLEILSDEIPLQLPEPADQDRWVSAAIEQNPLMLAAQAAVTTAKQEIRVQRSGHYPSLDMTAGYNYRDSNFGGLTPTQLERNDSSVGLELTLPLYQGGAVVSRTREQRYLYQQALEEQEGQYRATERQTRDNYRGIVSGISRVNALERAIESNLKAYEAAKSGFDVGTRDIVDVLDAQRELLRARRDYARSRYDYLLSTLRLKQAAGILTEEDLMLINAMLVADDVQVGIPGE